jgi:penicillin-binding protein 1A
MVLLTALRQGVNPESTTYNSHPIDIKSSIYGPIKVSTYGDTYQGNVNLVRATLTSDNSVYIQLDLDVGPDNVKDTARMMGIHSKLNGYPAEGIGGLTNGVSPLEMSHAYSTLATGGVRTKQLVISKVDFPNSKEDTTYKVHRKRVFSDGTVYELTKILEQNVDGGTATGVRGGGFTCPAAAKTGTTDNFRDAWLVGYTPTLATATWVGYPDAQRSMIGVEGVGQVNGGSLPTDIWTKFMKAAIGNHCKAFAQPKTPFVSKPFSGKYAEEGKKEGSADGSKKDYTEGKKKKADNGTGNGNGGGGGGNTTPQQTPDQPDTQAPPAPGGAAPGT